MGLGLFLTKYIQLNGINGFESYGTSHSGCLSRLYLGKSRCTVFTGSVQLKIPDAGWFEIYILNRNRNRQELMMNIKAVQFLLNGFYIQWSLSPTDYSFLRFFTGLTIAALTD